MDVKLRNMTAIYLLRGEQVLLLYRTGSRVVGNSYTGTAGGHFEQDELNDPRKCVLRELREETGLEDKDIRDLQLRYVTLRLKNGEIRQNYYFFAYLDEMPEKLESSEGKLVWARLDRLEQFEMPASARFMIDHYVREGRFTQELYGAVTEARGTRFVPLREF